MGHVFIAKFSPFGLGWSKISRNLLKKSQRMLNNFSKLKKLSYIDGSYFSPHKVSGGHFRPKLMYQTIFTGGGPGGKADRRLWGTGP